MILLGCLLAFGVAVAPRFFLILAWIFSDRWSVVWGGDFLMPLLGIIFLPFTTLMYVICWTPGVGLTGWDWFWVGLAVFLDIAHWGHTGWQNRKAVPGYSGSNATV